MNVRNLILGVVVPGALAITLSVPAFAGSPRTADILARLQAGKFATAERLARERLATVEREADRDSLEVANALDLLSEAMRQGGKGGQLEVGQICERAVRIKEKAVGTDHLGYAASIYQLGCWYYANGDYVQARPLLERSLRIREDTRGPDDLDTASSLYMVGALETDAGNHALAKELVERALSIRESAGPEQPGVAECLNGLANIYVRMGDYAKPEVMYRRAIRIWQRSWGADHPKVGTGWNNLSTLLYATGDYQGALECKERALKIRLRAFGPAHELVADTRSNMAMTLARLGRRAEAREEYRLAIAIQEHRYGQDSPEVGRTLKRLGDTYLTPGEYQDAVPILARALSNLQAGRGLDHPDAAEAMAALGAARTALGDTAIGNELSRRALETLKDRLGAAHPEVGFTLTQYGMALRTAGAAELALEAALQGEDVSREHLRVTCQGMPDRAGLAYAASRPAGGRLALSILQTIPLPTQETLARVWDSLIRSRTLVLDEMAARCRLASEQKDDETKHLLERLLITRRHLANLLVSAPGNLGGGQYRAALESARQDNESAERDLATHSLRFSRDQMRSRIGFSDVFTSLPPGSALLAYAAAGEGKGRSYVAFLTKAGSSKISFFPISSASRLETTVTRWLSAITAVGRVPPRRGEDPSRAWGDSLAALLWSPIARAVDGTSRVFIVGDGSILLVNFGALPVDRTHYLVERGPVLHYLVSERDIVRASHEAPSGAGLLAVGDPAFDVAPTGGTVARSRGADDDAGGYRQVLNCGDFANVRFPKLPKSGLEAREVARIWGDPRHTTVLTGTAADERTVKAKAHGRKVLHLATHGFFLGGCDDAVPVGSRGIGKLVPLTDQRRSSSLNPIHLSGLALAGANGRTLAGSESEDGILTAEEILSLDLTGTDWAVLSACDTGKGEIQVGEGVVGLRRAFQLAGAHTVIMSLWAVDDESARVWMTALYHGRVAGKLDTPDAITRADLQVLRTRRAQARSTDPFYWAAFVATGDWR